MNCARVLLLKHLPEAAQVRGREHHLEADRLEVEQLLLRQHVVVVTVEEAEDALQRKQEAAGHGLWGGAR